MGTIDNDLNNEKSERKKEDKERFIRWQGKLIDQSSYLNNLLTGIGIVVIGFVMNLISEKSSLISFTCCCQKVYFQCGLFLVFLSVVFGLAGAISRLYDFRTTVKKIKREKEGAVKGELEYLKEKYKTYGDFTWFCFYAQGGLLLVSIVVIGIVLLASW